MDVVKSQNIYHSKVVYVLNVDWVVDLISRFSGTPARYYMQINLRLKLSLHLLGLMVLDPFR